MAVSAAIAVSAALPVVAAEGITPGEAQRKMDGIDQAIADMRSDLANVAEGYRTPLQREGGRLARRMREAEVQALLGDHYRAAIVLFDVVGRPEQQSDPRYPDAVFLLAESLRKAGYPRAARPYYEELARVATGERSGQVVLGLLDVSSSTGDFTGVEESVRRLKAGSVSAEAAAVDFTYAKALYRGAQGDAGRLERALELFRSVPPALSVSAPASYYVGVTLVRMGRLDDALAAFERTLQLASTHPEGARIREMAALSLGRLHQEGGRISAALDAYQGISRDSPYFPDMLYEVAWVHVKAAELEQDAEAQRRSFQRALDAAELLMAAAPDSRLFPDARVLQGNLQIRLGAPDTAYDTFESIVAEFGEARTELARVLASRQDTRAFFEELVSADLDRLDRTSLVSPMVVRIALEDREIARVVDMRRSLARSGTELDDALELVRTLEAALRSEQRFGMFPGLRKARLRALALQNRILSQEHELLDIERRVLTPQLDADAVARLEASRARARELEESIATLPTTDEGVEGSREDLRAAYEKVSHRTYRLTSRARALRAQLVAAQLWMRTQRVQLRDEERALTEERMQRAQAEISALEEALDAVDDEIDRAAALSRGDGGWARAERLRQDLASAIEEQAALLSPARGRLSSDLRGVAQRIDAQRASLQGLGRELLGLQARLEQVVDARVDEVRQQIIDELRTVEGERAEHGQLARDADTLLEPVAERTMASVGREFQELVMKADVGILDVAWARKRARTDEVTGLVRELRQRSVELDDELGSVLEDE